MLIYYFRGLFCFVGTWAIECGEVGGDRGFTVGSINALSIASRASWRKKMMTICFTWSRNRRKWLEATKVKHEEEK